MFNSGENGIKSLLELFKIIELSLEKSFLIVMGITPYLHKSIWKNMLLKLSIKNKKEK